MSNLELLAIIFIILSILKISFILISKDAFNQFTKSYFNSMGKRPWLYHNIYMSCALLSLYIIIESGFSYIQILCTMICFGFMVHAAFTAYPKGVFSKLTLDNVNWKRMSIYIIVLIYIMIKAALEIF